MSLVGVSPWKAIVVQAYSSSYKLQNHSNISYAQILFEAVFFALVFLVCTLIYFYSNLKANIFLKFTVLNQNKIKFSPICSVY